MFPSGEARCSENNLLLVIQSAITKKHNLRAKYQENWRNGHQALKTLI